MSRASLSSAGLHLAVELAELLARGVELVAELDGLYGLAAHERDGAVVPHLPLLRELGRHRVVHHLDGEVRALQVGEVRLDLAQHLGGGREEEHDPDGLVQVLHDRARGLAYGRRLEEAVVEALVVLLREPVDREEHPEPEGEREATLDRRAEAPRVDAPGTRVQRAVDRERRERAGHPHEGDERLDRGARVIERLAGEAEALERVLAADRVEHEREQGQGVEAERGLRGRGVRRERAGAERDGGEGPEPARAEQRVAHRVVPAEHPLGEEDRGVAEEEAVAGRAHSHLRAMSERLARSRKAKVIDRKKTMPCVSMRPSWKGWSCLSKKAT